MPLNCPRNFLKYNDCLDCRHRHENKCWFNVPIVQKLSDILTIEERIAILEDRKEVPPVDIVTISRQDYQQLQRLLLLLEEKINSHIDKTKGRNYKDYKIA